MKSTVVDESLSTNATRVLFQRGTNFITSRDNRMRNLHQINFLYTKLLGEKFNKFRLKFSSIVGMS